MDLLVGYGAGAVLVALPVTLGSAFVRGLTGFGMAILLVPVLALALAPVEAVLLTNFLSLFIGLWEFPRLVRGAERSARTIIAMVVATTPLGLWALSVSPPDMARVVIAAIALIAFVALLFPRRAALDHHPAVTGGVGVLSGLMTGYAGMPGPPVVPYYVGRDIARETAKASMMLIFTCASAVGLASGAALGVLEFSHFLLAGLAFPAVLLGNRLGNHASQSVGDRSWRIGVGLVLGGAAAAAIARAVG